MNEKILKELQEIKKLLQVIVSNQEQEKGIIFDSSKISEAIRFSERSGF